MMEYDLNDVEIEENMYSYSMYQQQQEHEYFLFN